MQQSELSEVQLGFPTLSFLAAAGPGCSPFGAASGFERQLSIHLHHRGPHSRRAAVEITLYHTERKSLIVAQALCNSLSPARVSAGCGASAAVGDGKRRHWSVGGTQTLRRRGTTAAAGILQTIYQQGCYPRLSKWLPIGLAR